MHCRQKFPSQFQERRLLHEGAAEQPQSQGEKAPRRTWQEKMQDPLNRENRRKLDSMKEQINKELEERGIEILDAQNGYEFAGEKGKKRNGFTLRKNETDVHAVTIAGHTVQFRFNPKVGWEWKEANDTIRDFKSVNDGSRYILSDRDDGSMTVDKMERLGFNQIADQLSQIKLGDKDREIRDERKPEEIAAQEMATGIDFLKKMNGAVVRGNTAIVPISDGRSDGILLSFDYKDGREARWVWAYMPDRNSPTFPETKPLFMLNTVPGGKGKIDLTSSRKGRVNAFLEVFENHVLTTDQR